MSNQDTRVIEEFGDEWTKFNYNEVELEKLKENFDQYFSIFPWQLISMDSEGFDMGCGSGRWAQFVSPLVKKLNCIEPSQAIEVAKANLKEHTNINFYNETTDICSLNENSQDFGYSLGVLHHIPDTMEALKDCSKLLKSGAPFLIYLYYNFENKPLWFKAVWKISDYFRKFISKLPKPAKMLCCSIIAVIVYYPLARAALILENLGFNVENMPLSDYRKKPFYQCKNDALDRFGTRLEQRFSKAKIMDMLQKSGFEDINFSSHTPYWCCVAIKK
jgi:SAM-dependent methyltransferase